MTGFHLGKSSEQSASLHQAGVIHLETHLGFLVSKKEGTEMLWGVDGVDMDWREKVISTCQVMRFATSCPRVLVIVSCLAELCPQSLSLSVSFPKSQWGNISSFLPILIQEQSMEAVVEGTPRGGTEQRIFLFPAAISSLGAVCLWSRGVWPSLLWTLPSSLSRAGPVAAGAG